MRKVVAVVLFILGTLAGMGALYLTGDTWSQTAGAPEFTGTVVEPLDSKQSLGDVVYTDNNGQEARARIITGNPDQFLPGTSVNFYLVGKSRALVNDFFCLYLGLVILGTLAVLSMAAAVLLLVNKLKLLIFTYSAFFTLLILALAVPALGTEWALQTRGTPVMGQMVDSHREFLSDTSSYKKKKRSTRVITVTYTDPSLKTHTVELQDQELRFHPGDPVPLMVQFEPRPRAALKGWEEFEVMALIFGVFTLVTMVTAVISGIFVFKRKVFKRKKS